MTDSAGVFWRILEGDCRDVLRSLPERSVQTCVTSPPYFGLRDYGTGDWDGGDPACSHQHPKAGDVSRNQASSTLGGGKATTGHATNGAGRECRCGARRIDRQIGLELTPDEFVAALVGVFREVRRVLRDDGTVWLNLGDSYSGSPRGNGDDWTSSGLTGVQSPRYQSTLNAGTAQTADKSRLPGIKPKDLIGVPWAVAFALRADGWYLRSDIIWAKPNPMPESVTDRPTKAHEYVFLLSKSARYFYDADAIREPHEGYMAEWRSKNGREEIGPKWKAMEEDGTHGTGGFSGGMNPNGRNKRSVWSVATQPFAGAHFATFPPKLIEPCILAGTAPKACGVCGTAWRRVVERIRDEVEAERIRQRPGRAESKASANGDRRDGDLQGLSGQEFNRLYSAHTVGWESGCEHDDDTGRCVVLDPFNGAGTTGLVALRHDRSYVGVELNGDYAEMARRRIIDDAPLLNAHSHKEAA